MKQEELELLSIQARFCRTMGNANRLMILEVLAQGEASVGEIADAIGASMTNVSQHLAILKANNIVQFRKKGQLVIYHLTDPRIMEACDLIRSVLLSFMEKNESVLKSMTSAFMGD